MSVPKQKQTLIRLVSAMRRMRVLAQPPDRTPAPLVPSARPPVALRKQVATQPLQSKAVAPAPVVAATPPRLTPERLRAAAEALAQTEMGRTSRTGLPIQAHESAPISEHILETMRQQPAALPVGRVNPSMLTRLGRSMAGMVGMPNQEMRELRLNPHRRDEARPDALVKRVQDHRHLPAAMLRGMSEAAGEGLEQMEGMMRRTVAAPFTRPGSWGERVQHTPPHAGSQARVETDLPEWEGAAPAAAEAVGEEFFDTEEIAPEGEASEGLSSWSSVRIGSSLAAVLVLAVAVLGPIQLARSYLGTTAALSRAKTQGATAVAAVATATGAAKGRDAVGAESALAAAGVALGDVRNTFGPIGVGLMALAERLPGDSQVEAGAVLLSAGETFTRVGAQVAEALAALPPDASPTSVIVALQTSLLGELPALAEAAEAVSRISPESIPEAYRAEAEPILAGARAIAPAITEAGPLFETLLTFLGHTTPQRYLLVFQNQNELRATGGFIGSYAEITMAEGKITSVLLPPGGSYHIQGDVRAWLNPPDPLRLVTSRWRFHDANWFADFPTSAEKLAWFYEKSGGPTVDGVIAVNATMLEEILRVTGPVPMPAYGVTLTADNVLDTVQRVVELAPSDPAAPKQILADLFPILLDRLQAPDPDETLALAELLARGLKEKRVQLYAHDPDVQDVFAARGWDGGIQATDGDSLAVVTTNIGGEKSDAMMHDVVSHHVEISADGKVVDTVTFTRTHTGEAGVPLTGVRNISYLRAYVPLGSRLLAASGDFATPPANLFVPRDPAFGDDEDVRAALTGLEDAKSGVRTLEESGKTVFAHWMQVLPGETKTVRFQYELPGRLALPKQNLWAALTGGSERSAYRLLVQKQSGAEQRSYALSVSVPPTTRPVFTVPNTLTVSDQTVTLPEDRLASDRYYAVLLEQH